MRRKSPKHTKTLFCSLSRTNLALRPRNVVPGTPTLLWGFLLNSETSEGCSKGVDSEIVGVVMSSLSVHAWSLVTTVTSGVIANIVVVVVLLLPLVIFSMMA